MGCNNEPTLDTCQEPHSSVLCDEKKLGPNEEPKRGTEENKHLRYVNHHHCDDRCCPVCYPWHARKLAKNALARVQGFHDVHPEKPLAHVNVSAPKFLNFGSLKEAYSELKRVNKILGAEGFVSIAHSHRLKKNIKYLLQHYKIDNNLFPHTGDWDLAHQDVLGLGGLEHYVEIGWHFHLVATGYLMDYRKFYEKTGWTYKRIRFLNSSFDVMRVLYYVATHCTVEKGCEVAHWFGTMSRRQLPKIVSWTRYELVRCDYCASRCSEYLWSLSNEKFFEEPLDKSVTIEVEYIIFGSKGPPSYRTGACWEHVIRHEKSGR